MPHSPELLLQLLQVFLKNQNQNQNPNSNQIKQIHSILLTTGNLLYNSNTSKWMNTLLYNALIRGYMSFGQAHHRHYHHSLVLFKHMLAHQAPPNSHTFPSLIKAASSSSSPSFATSLHSQALKRGVLRDPFVQTSFLCFYAHYALLRDARKVFVEITHPCIVAHNAMLDAFTKNGDVASAVSLFESMPQRDVVSWTSAIHGFGINGCFKEVIEFFKRMTCLVKPNEATYVTVISSCADLDGRGALYLGKQIHANIIRNHTSLTVFMSTALVHLYGNAGCLKSAANVFNQMVFKEIYSWNAMISALSSNGMEKEALDLFETLKKEGSHPNKVTFVAVLTACARSRFIELGLELFRSMSRDFGIVPIMEHYGCVVDMMGRAGLLKEAAEFIERMPFEPDASVLGALMGACKIYGTTKLGNEVGQKLLQLQPQHCGRYVVLSNINVEMERWDCAATLRKMMVDAGIRKIPAYSVVALS